MPKQTYTPRADSLPAKVIAHLQKVGGTVTNIEIEALFKAGRNNVGTLLGKAVTAGMLRRFRSTANNRGYVYELGEAAAAPTTDDTTGSPFTNPAVGLPELAPGQIEISHWSDGEIYVHGLHVASDGSVLFTLAQMRKLVLHVTDPLGLRR